MENLGSKLGLYPSLTSLFLWWFGFIFMLVHLERQMNQLRANFFKHKNLCKIPYPTVHNLNFIFSVTDYQNLNFISIFQSACMYIQMNPKGDLMHVISVALMHYGFRQHVLCKPDLHITL